MAATAAKKKMKMFHATMHVTRLRNGAWKLQRPRRLARCSPTALAIAAIPAKVCTPKSESFWRNDMPGSLQQDW
jgi:hypothetical protein